MPFVQDTSEPYDDKGRTAASPALLTVRTPVPSTAGSVRRSARSRPVLALRGAPPGTSTSKEGGAVVPDPGVDHGRGRGRRVKLQFTMLGGRNVAPSKHCPVALRYLFARPDGLETAVTATVTTTRDASVSFAPDPTSCAASFDRRHERRGIIAGGTCRIRSGACNPSSSCSSCSSSSSSCSTTSTSSITLGRPPPRLPGRWPDPSTTTTDAAYTASRTPLRRLVRAAEDTWPRRSTRHLVLIQPRRSPPGAAAAAAAAAAGTQRTPVRQVRQTAAAPSSSSGTPGSAAAAHPRPCRSGCRGHRTAARWTRR